MTHKPRHMLIVIVAAATLAPTPVCSQSLILMNGLGYATAGAVVGIAATANSGCSDSDWCIIPDAMAPALLFGALFGGAAGVAIASTAEDEVAKGKPVGGAHLVALSIGTVLGGATLGATAGSVLVERMGLVLGSDMQTIALCTAAGAGYGVVRLRRRWNELRGRSVEVRPVVLNGGYRGIAVSIHF